jgi:O-antigen ligase
LLGLDPAAHGMLARLRGGELACASRITLWSNVLNLIGQKPWLGWGWGELDYAHYMHLYGQSPRFCDILDNAHNLPLHVAVELGVPAALLLCGAVVWGVLRARPWRETDATANWPGACWRCSSTACWNIRSGTGPFQIALGLSLGLLARPVHRCASPGDADAVVSGCCHAALACSPTPPGTTSA